MKICTVVGARPQFIKAATVSLALKNSSSNIKEVLIHTGQHYDSNMSDIFFSDLGISKPDYNLAIGGGSHGKNTGRMIEKIEELLLIEKPDSLIVYGDTDSTLAGAIAASKLHIPVSHVEAGLRSYNMAMPEEINRLLTDNVSSQLFCPTAVAIENLRREGFYNRDVLISEVGDVMLDAAIHFKGAALKPEGLDVKGDFILATFHRAENTDDVDRLKSIVSAINHLHITVAPVVVPLHPRTVNALKKHDLKLNCHLIQPVGYIQMIWLLSKCALVLTDSGGVQKEAFFFNKSCVTMRGETEWTELVDLGVNILSGADQERIIEFAKNMYAKAIPDIGEMYGAGLASQRIASALV